jgi:putative ubiquitin-RnfH superfamily antitoxin RatB of RatAB toxin-antitoxin module
MARHHNTVSQIEVLYALVDKLDSCLLQLEQNADAIRDAAHITSALQDVVAVLEAEICKLTADPEYA